MDNAPKKELAKFAALGMWFSLLMFAVKWFVNRGSNLIDLFSFPSIICMGMALQDESRMSASRWACLMLIIIVTLAFGIAAHWFFENYGLFPTVIVTLVLGAVLGVFIYFLFFMNQSKRLEESDSN